MVLLDLDSLRQKSLEAQKKGREAYLAEINESREIIRQYQLKRLAKYNVWLKKMIGRPPPYEYGNWGEIAACIDEREEDVEILVRFKYDFGEESDLSIYFASRREQERRFAVNPPKPSVPGQLPPGFSRKI